MTLAAQSSGSAVLPTQAASGSSKIRNARRAFITISKMPPAAEPPIKLFRWSRHQYLAMLLQDRPKGAVPFRARRMLLIIADARQMQVIKLLADARQTPRLGNQLLGDAPVLLADGLEDRSIKNRRRRDF